jgi:uncharacterized protein
MATQIFVNLPVKNLNRSVNFFTALGYTFNPEFTNDKATCMIVSDTIYVMLLTETFFKSFINKEICDTNTAHEAIICLSADSREAIDEMVNKAVAAGSPATSEPQDYGFMYNRGFTDPDGHLWEYSYMLPQPVQQ